MRSQLHKIRKVGLALVVGAMTFGTSVWAETPCQVADRYLDLAEQATTDFRYEDAAKFLGHATESCPTWAAWQKLAETSAELGDANEAAANAFKQAYERYAETPEQKAASAAGFAELLLLADGNPKRAETWVFHALNFAPEDPEILALASKIEAASAQPTEDQITRGFFSDLADRGPVMQREVAVAPELGGGSGGGDSIAAPAPAAPNAPVRIDYALNFYTDSDTLYPESLALIESIAATLEGNPRFESRTFRLVGHSDARGPADHNEQLSMKRAQRVRDLLVSRVPGLDGRIQIDGRGEAELRDRRESQDAHRRNRRVELWML